MNQNSVIDFYYTTGPNGDGKISLGSVEGTGGLVSLGSTQLSLGGNNLSTVFDGSFADYSSLETISPTYVFPGVGNGSLTKVGTGTLTLNGANTYTGPIIVQAGALAGSGSVVTLINNATVIATSGLSVTGNYSQNSSGTLVVQATPAGASTPLVVGGTASLAGNLSILSPTGFGFGTRYTAVSTSGGVSGQIANAPVNATARFVTSSDANNEYFTLSPISMTTLGGSANQNAVERGLDRLIFAAYGSGNAGGIAVVNAIDNQTSAQTLATLTSLSGEGYGGFAASGVASGQAFSDAVLQAFGGGAGGADGMALNNSPSRMMVASIDPGFVPLPGAEAKYGVWMSGYGQTTAIDGNANTHGLNSTIGGGAIGADIAVRPDLRAGMAVGYGGGDFSAKSTGDRGHADNGQLALYAGLDLGSAYVDGMAGMATFDGSMRRNIVLSGLNAVARSTTRGSGGFGALEFGLRESLTDDLRVSPFFSIQANGFNQDRSAEQSTSPLALNVAGAHSVSVLSTLGARLRTDFSLADTRMGGELTLGWSHEFADTSAPVSASFIGQPNSGFTIATSGPARDHAVVGLGVTAAITRQTSVFARYNGSLAQSDSANAVQAGVRMSF